MKLIYCPVCKDIVKLTRRIRSCQCGQSSGRYKDDVNAIISGRSIPLGIDNTSFLKARLARPYHDIGDGALFTAFVIPHNCDTVEVE